MQLPLMLVLLSIPSLIYIAVQKRRGEKWPAILKNIGWQTGRPVCYLWGLGILIVMGGLGGLAFQTIPAEVLHSPNITLSGYAGWSLSLTSFLLILLREAIYVALGEEIFFRGFLGGWLVRRFGFAIGNALQALVFLLPHLFLLLVSLTLWPILIVQALAGWLLGWMRHRAGSILPGWIVHSLINALGALAMLG